MTSSGLPWADSGRPDWILRHRQLRMVCLRLYSLLGIAGYAGLDGGLRAMGRWAVARLMCPSAPDAAAAAAALLQAEEVTAGQLRDGDVTDADLEEAGLAADAIAAIAAWRTAAADA